MNVTKEYNKSDSQTLQVTKYWADNELLIICHLNRCAGIYILSLHLCFVKSGKGILVTESLEENVMVRSGIKILSQNELKWTVVIKDVHRQSRKN